jgi:hypothetical protein
MRSQYTEWHRRQEEALAATPPYPAEKYSGRGVVICAGGARYFTCAWVLLRVLREIVHCELPVEVWHLGTAEMDSSMRSLLIEAGADVIDASLVPAARPAEKGWPFKPFAILHSRFREVVLIDADNIPVQDPAKLFDTPEYVRCGALFWEDIERLDRDSPIWEICRLDYRDEPAFESGQLVIDKLRCWRALNLTMHMNENSHFYYRFLYGDKDTFHMAWRMTGQPYARPANSVRLLSPYRQPEWPMYWGPVLAQTDFQGRRFFQHKNFPKWILFGYNPHYPLFQYENECLKFLDDLAGCWNGRVSTPPPPLPEDRAPHSRWFRYVRISADERLLEFLPDGRVGHGNARCERNWRIVRQHGNPVLQIHGDGFLSCELRMQSDGIWRGPWNYFERNPVELVPIDGAPLSGNSWLPARLSQFWRSSGRNR